MKFKWRLPPEVRAKMKQEARKKEIATRNKWHRWFAWHPVRLGMTEFCWLEVVERRGRYMDDWFGGTTIWQYRTLR